MAKLRKGAISLSFSNPDLCKEWDYDKNAPLTPGNFSSGSNIKVWWKCSNDHEWQARIADRIKGRGCPFCAGQRVIKGENDLATKYPELAFQWDYEKNAPLLPSDVMPNSNRKVWWKCEKGHEWESQPNNRVAGDTGCPYCTNRKILPGFNDLSTTNPELVKEWDYDRNKIRPTEISSGSGMNIWWKCPVGHSYDMRLFYRNKGVGCPYCVGKRVLLGFNDLATTHPELVKEWHYEKNTLEPISYTAGSNKNVWWKCAEGHEWQARITSRVRGTGCPYCSGRYAIKGINDFATKHPELLIEWDFDKNTISPDEVLSSSHYRAWWKCPLGHSYSAWISNRVYQQSGCSICNKESHSSFPEQAVFFYVKKYYPDAINSDTTAIGLELDIYIPSINVAIEYDGVAWHKSTKSEERKNKACKDKNILLIRIREEGLKSYDDCCCIIRNNIGTNESLSEVIRTMLSGINFNSKIDVDVDRDSTIIYNSYIFTRKSQSLLIRYPEIAAEWHPTKNGEITAEMVTPKTSKKVWWLGTCGHEWQATVVNRTNRNSGCPYCNGSKAISGTNDLLTLYPKMCDEWDYEKNSEIGLSPDKVSVYSDKIAFWKCNNCGNEWQAAIKSRSKGSGCPRCADVKRSKSKYKSVQCVETGIIYESIKDAVLKTGIKYNIGACCHGKYETAGGYHWKFIN